MGNFVFGIAMAMFVGLNVWFGSNINLGAGAFIFTSTICRFLDQIIIEISEIRRNN